MNDYRKPSIQKRQKSILGGLAYWKNRKIREECSRKGEEIKKKTQAGSRSHRDLKAMISLSFILRINQKPQKDFKEEVTYSD